ncbi:MAG: hypothetical protein KY451_06470 [Actinobacteria bacterium]|nr:hypothetical protein [Actinomycetota bacterium]MBW3646462.1 hypothetical protein [Actinomycetota bacterium]
MSKETPLYDPAKVYRAAVESLLGPARVSGLLADAAASLDPDSPRYSELTRWLHAPSRPVDERFAATLLLHDKLRGGEVSDGDEIVDAVVRFWSGDPIRVPDLRRALKAVGAGGHYSFAAISAKELARQRLRFAARLLRAAGHPGWVILFDEVELIGRYSLLQRGRSCAELSRWVGGDPDDPTLPVAAVLAMTDDLRGLRPDRQGGPHQGSGQAARQADRRVGRDGRAGEEGHSVDRARSDAARGARQGRARPGLRHAQGIAR